MMMKGGGFIIYLAIAAAQVAHVANAVKHHPVPGRYVKYADLSQCPTLRRRGAPDSADDVRPDEIEVVMAMGDSLSAALVARDSPDNDGSVSESQHLQKSFSAADPSKWIEYRGIAYPTGMDPDAISIASILSHYTNLTGGSVGHAQPLGCASKACGRSDDDGLDAAISGSVASSLKSQVTDWLIPRLREMNVSDQAWKYVNIGVGGNDLCGYCLTPDVGYPTSHSPKQYARDIKEAVDHLRIHVPRLIVNIVGMFRITPLYELKLRSPKCSHLPLFPHSSPSSSSSSSSSPGGIPNFPLECTCALLPGPAGDITRARMDALADAYDQALLNVIKGWESEWDPYMGVIWQPGSGIDLGQWPEEALSGVDCFHPSWEAHRRVAGGFWNRMVGDLKQKAVPIRWEEQVVIRCLEEGDRFPVGKVTKQRGSIGK